MSDGELLRSFLVAAAKKDALGFSDPVEESYTLLVQTVREAAFREELLLRMGGGVANHNDERLLQWLVGIYVNSGGEDRPPRIREEIDQLSAQVLERASQTPKTLQSV